MFDFEQQIPVRLKFPAMPEPVTISVPTYVLLYLDSHAERMISSEGEAIYRNPEYPSVQRRRQEQTAPMRACA